MFSHLEPPVGILCVLLGPGGCASHRIFSSSWWSDSVPDVPPWVSRPVAKPLRLRERELGLSGFVIKGGPRALL